MSFEIVDKSYCAEAEGRDPKVYGYLEGYTSNTVSQERYLRLNCKAIIDEEKLDWYKRVYGVIPLIEHFGKGCYEKAEPGDIIGGGIRLTESQVKELIYELSKWLSENN